MRALAVSTFCGILISSALLPIGIAGLGIVYALEDDRRTIGLVALWIGTIVLIAMGVSYLEQKIAFSKESIPPEKNLIRNMRYLILMLEILAVWGAASLWRRIPLIWLKSVLLTLVLLAMIFTNWATLVRYGSRVLEGWMSGSFVPPAKQADVILGHAAEAIKVNTEVGSRILPFGLKSPLRDNLAS